MPTVKTQLRPNVDNYIKPAQDSKFFSLIFISSHTFGKYLHLSTSRITEMSKKIDKQLR